jgi:large subunit ribosomal protein L17
MRHKIAHRKLGRKSDHRQALLRNMCTSLIVHERLITTLPKAKELRPFAERVITLGKRALLSEAPEAVVHARRQAAVYFYTGNANRVPDGGYKRPRAPRTAGILALDKLFDEIAARYTERPGGYTRILKLGVRRGDGAEMALIELIGSESKAAHEEEKPEQKKTRRRLFGRRKKAEISEGVPKEQPIKKSAKSKASSKSDKSDEKSGTEAKSKARDKKKADDE